MTILPNNALQPTREKRAAERGVRQAARDMTDVVHPSRYQCCFCGQSIAGEPPREMVLTLEGDATQHLYCHEGCLRQALHPSVPVGF
jgi:hypothetical protein